jgi:hypothetical protein
MQPRGMYELRDLE